MRPVRFVCRCCTRGQVCAIRLRLSGSVPFPVAVIFGEGEATTRPPVLDLKSPESDVSSTGPDLRVYSSARDLNLTCLSWRDLQGDSHLCSYPGAGPLRQN
jgi:hypothetical protein